MVFEKLRPAAACKNEKTKKGWNSAAEQGL